MQACGCAAERACACKRACVREHACTAAGACGYTGQRWGGCVALPVQGRGWRVRCGQGEGLHHPTDHLRQWLLEPAGRSRAGTAVENCRQGPCSCPACGYWPAWPVQEQPCSRGATSSLQPCSWKGSSPGNAQGRPRLQPMRAPLCCRRAVPAQPASVPCLSFPISAVLAVSRAGGHRGQAPCWCSRACPGDDVPRDVWPL